MRRISMWEVLGAFAISAVVAVGASALIGAIRLRGVQGDNERLAADRHILAVIEGSERVDDRREESVIAAITSLRTLLGERREMNVEGAFGLAGNMGNAQPGALNAIVPSDRWRLLAPLNNEGARDRLLSLDRTYNLTEVFRAGDRPSTRIAFAAEPPIWTRTEAAIWYLVGCLGFLLIYGIRAYLSRKHPILDAPWNRFPCLLAFAAAAPLAAPCLIAYGTWRLFRAEMSWSEWWRAFAQGVRVVGYRLRILRRLPTPVITPAVVTAAPSVITTASAPTPAPAPQAARPEEDAEDEAEEEEEEGPPEWYVIHPDELLGREHLLAAAGVPVYPITIAVPEKLKGFAVEASRIEDFERALDLVDADPEDEDTDIARTVRRSYDGTVGDIAVTHVPSERYETVEKVLETVSMNSNGVSIAFSNAGGRVARSTVSEDEWIEVFHFCAPTVEQRWTRLPGAYGAVCDMSAIRPSDQGGLVVKDADGNEVVQVIGRKVFILCDLFSLDDERFPSVLARALYDGVRAAEKNPLDDDGDAAAWRSALDAERDAYVQLCLQNVDARRDAIERELKGHDEEIRECGQRITVAVRKRHGAQKTLDRLVNEERTAEIERLKREFDQLAAAKPVLAVRAYDDRIEVDTRTVHVRHMGRRYEIGRFRIVIDSAGRLSLDNLSNTGRDTHCEHPHVRGRQPCLGNLTEALHKLLGEREYALAVNMLFKFLESYNPGNPFSRIEHWKEVSR